MSNLSKIWLKYGSKSLPRGEIKYYHKRQKVSKIRYLKWKTADFGLKNNAH